MSGVSVADCFSLPPLATLSFTLSLPPPPFPTLLFSLSAKSFLSVHCNDLKCHQELKPVTNHNRKEVFKNIRENENEGVELS